MARVNFVRTFRYYPLWPSKATYTEYKAATEHTVKRECADLAIAEGAGVEIKPPRRRKKAEDAC
jgi:hypothetical protein